MIYFFTPADKRRALSFRSILCLIRLFSADRIVSAYCYSARYPAAISPSCCTGSLFILGLTIRRMDFL